MMKQLYKPLKLTIAGAAVAGFTVAGMTLASAQNGEKEAEAEAEGIATASAEEICEAQQRTEARWQKWINEGIPEEFGSEEPFTFQPGKCPK